MPTVYWKCLVCSERGETYAGGDRHTKDTDHGTTMSNKPFPDTSVD